MNKDMKKYLRELKILLPVHGEKEKIFLEDIKSSILEITDNQENITYEFLCNEFGRPQDIIINYFSEIDHEYLRKKLRIASVVRKTAIIFIVLVLLLIVYRAVIIYDSYLDAKDAVITQEVTVIE